jgi:hypothetical protein
MAVLTAILSPAPFERTAVLVMTGSVQIEFWTVVAWYGGLGQNRKRTHRERQRRAHENDQAVHRKVSISGL